MDSNMTLDARIKAALGEMMFNNIVLQHQLVEAQERLQDDKENDGPPAPVHPKRSSKRKTD